MKKRIEISKHTLVHVLQAAYNGESFYTFNRAIGICNVSFDPADMLGT